MKPERIIGVAATHPDGGVYSMLAPSRHGQILQLVYACYRGRDEHAGLRVTQGFVTDQFRFVDRVEARKIADAAGQTSERDAHLAELFSEDLW